MSTARKGEVMKNAIFHLRLDHVDHLRLDVDLRSDDNGSLTSS